MPNLNVDWHDHRYKIMSSRRSSTRTLIASVIAANKVVGGAINQRARLLVAGIKRKRSRAKFVVVTGSSGKTTTVGLLSHILSSSLHVRTQVVDNSILSAANFLKGVGPGVDVAVLEAGTAGPGDIERIVRLVKPDVAIVTLVAIEHYSAFRSIEAIAKEKAAAVEALSGSGLAILNFDDLNVREMSKLTPARVQTFGTAGGAYKVSNVRTTNGRVALDLSFDNQRIAIESQLLGEHNWLAITAAVTCALELGIPAHAVSERVATFMPVYGRMSVHPLEGGPTFILDTAKAPYHSISLPLKTLGSMTAPRKRFILGQISDYSGNSKKKYRDTYRAACEIADEVIFVGVNAKRAQATREDVEQGRFYAFDTVEEASAHLKKTAVEAELLLVKSATNLHLERLWLDWTGDVRCWPNDCGKKIACTACGQWRRPFAEHEGRKNQPRKFWRMIEAGKARVIGSGRIK